MNSPIMIPRRSVYTCSKARNVATRPSGIFVLKDGAIRTLK